MVAVGGLVVCTTCANGMQACVRLRIERGLVRASVSLGVVCEVVDVAVGRREVVRALGLVDHCCG